MAQKSWREGARALPVSSLTTWEGRRCCGAAWRVLAGVAASGAALLEQARARQEQAGARATATAAAAVRAFQFQLHSLTFLTVLQRKGALGVLGWVWLRGRSAG